MKAFKSHALWAWFFALTACVEGFLFNLWLFVFSVIRIGLLKNPFWLSGHPLIWINHGRGDWTNTSYKGKVQSLKIISIFFLPELHWVLKEEEFDLCDPSEICLVVFFTTEDPEQLQRTRRVEALCELSVNLRALCGYKRILLFRVFFFK